MKYNDKHPLIITVKEMMIELLFLNQPTKKVHDNFKKHAETYLDRAGTEYGFTSHEIKVKFLKRQNAVKVGITLDFKTKTKIFNFVLSNRKIPLKEMRRLTNTTN